VNRRALLAALAAAAALCACNNHGGGVTLRLAQPSSLAVAGAQSHVHLPPDPWPFAFVASTGHNELVVFDAITDAVLSAPIILRALSIPTLDPRPALVASAEFQPPGSGAPRPGLVVATSAGSTQLQLIRTWLSDAASDPGLADEAPVELGGQVLALVAAPAVAADGTKLSDTIRVVAALVDGRLAVVDYAWKGDPTLAETGTGTSRTNCATAGGVTDAVTHDLSFDGGASNFDALSLAVDPINPRYLYAATIDTAQGVAQFDMAGAGTWTPVAIDAGGPTLLVAALTVRERVATVDGAYDQVAYPDGPAVNDDAFEPDAHRRVYALRDPSSCGPATALPCGIVVLDPEAVGLARPPFLGGQEPFPITVPSRPLALLAGAPPTAPPTDTIPSEIVTNPDGSVKETLARIHAVTSRNTTGVLAIPCENGRIYLADLSRWEVPSGELEVNGTSTATGVSSFTSSAATSRRVGFYKPSYLAADTTRRSWTLDQGAISYLELTPGFTPDDTWKVTYQGYLPDFTASRAAQVTASGDNLVVAFQVPTGNVLNPFTQVVNVNDPALGVRVGDIVEFWTGPTRNDPAATQRVDGGTLCPDTTTTGFDGLDIQPIEGRVVSVNPADSGHPGGWLLVRKAHSNPVNPGDPPAECVAYDGSPAKPPDCNTRGPWDDKPNCWSNLSVPTSASPSGANPGTLQVRIRTGGGTAGAEEFVVVGTATGYAGRAVSTVITPSSTSLPTFSFTNENEAALVTACPLLNGGSCGDEACRRSCEAAVIARRARRTHLTSVACPLNSTGTPSHCETFFQAFRRPNATDPPPAFPLPPAGPALAFSLALTCVSPDVTGCAPEQITTLTRKLIRDTQVAFTTRSGWFPASRFGGGANGGAGTQPTGAAYIDRTTNNARFDKQSDRYRFLVPYVDNLVLDVSFGQTNGETRVIR
jgi:hypothetical protein